MKKKALAQIAFEFLSIVFAVLLALGLNSYKQNSDLKNEATNIKQNVLAEFQNNLNKIESVLANNKEYTSYLDSIVSLPEEQVNSFYFNYEFELLTSSAWDVAQNSSAIGLLDDEFLLEAADLYHSQDFYEQYARNVFQSIGEAMMRRDELKESNLAMSMYYSSGVLENTANTLKLGYEDFLKKYE